ncbi:hypothetical protein L798_07065 [Zootermopsis nevadensis]|uniref:Uncharacterized protein n=1 Tax=Zootermopsis nevadensis TaxID=136037 RepID=A0A067R613_ZOONE|nr:hypothetical protein L798_07065 [Zootermopsis nevadensis]
MNELGLLYSNVIQPMKCVLLLFAEVGHAVSPPNFYETIQRNTQTTAIFNYLPISKNLPCNLIN